MSNRYRLPDPKCRHARRGRVFAGDPYGAYASTQVCDRAECIADAMEWATATTHQPAQHQPDPDRTPEPSLFDYLRDQGGSVMSADPHEGGAA